MSNRIETKVSITAQGTCLTRTISYNEKDLEGLTMYFNQESINNTFNIVNEYAGGNSLILTVIYSCRISYCS
ncbi:hypothetical protein Ga0466249_001125 [Sporomusaceae bacterium BoRhaA]|nr:hypothetical protein [Pelorhabdus rhamnosifermentans]